MAKHAFGMADQNTHVRPVPPDAMDDVPQHPRDLFSGRPLARPQQRQDRLAGVGLEDEHRLEACAASVRVEQGELLAASMRSMAPVRP